MNKGLFREYLLAIFFGVMIIFFVGYVAYIIHLKNEDNDFCQEKTGVIVVDYDLVNYDDIKNISFINCCYTGEPKINSVNGKYEEVEICKGFKRENDNGKHLA